MIHEMKQSLWLMGCAYCELRARGFSHAELDGLRLAMRMVKRNGNYADLKLSLASRFPWRSA
jgi:hypothetical protein